jgi:hypothetical protein
VDSVVEVASVLLSVKCDGGGVVIIVVGSVGV